MIVKTEREMIVKVRVHEFKCDGCGKHLGEVEEHKYLDYIPELGDVELNFHLPDGWYKYKAHLCDECKKVQMKYIAEKLENLGFEKQGVM